MQRFSLKCRLRKTIIAMQDFADIRPYNDAEVPAVLRRLLADPEFLDAISSLKFKGLARWLRWPLRSLVRVVLRRELAAVTDVKGLQAVIERYMSSMIEDTTAGFSVSGLQTLEPGQAYLLMSNHRDIALDPAFTSYALFNNGLDTARTAIGDNLLTTPYVSDLMRLNKSFIVKRSARGPRQILKAYRELSAYIRQSIQREGVDIWIAQREGRAKDGFDRTEPAIIKMLAMSQDKKTESFAEFIQSLNIVPVSISYELDPCDGLKAAELQALAEIGSYQKSEDEDVSSIATGIAGNKGQVHVAFGTPLGAGYDTPEAVATEVDRQVISNYHLHSSNLYAYRALHAEAPPLSAGIEVIEGGCSEAEFQQRVAEIPAAQRSYALGIYANAITSKLRLAAGTAATEAATPGSPTVAD
jgi:hypothetical protein